MPRKPRPLTEPELYARALKAIAGRARSVAEMRRLLLRRAARPADADEIVRRLKDLGYLNDEKFAHSYAAWRLENQRMGRRRVERDLRARLVAPKLAERAVEKPTRMWTKPNLCASTSPAACAAPARPRTGANSPHSTATWSAPVFLPARSEERRVGKECRL